VQGEFQLEHVLIVKYCNQREWELKHLPLKHVRMINLTRLRPCKENLLMYEGVLDYFTFDFSTWKWLKKASLLYYTSKAGQELMN